MAQDKLKRIKKEARLSIDLNIQAPDLSIGASYKSPYRKMKVFINGELKATLNSSDTLTFPCRVRDVIVVYKVFEKDNGNQTIDFTQKYIVGQNFIDCTFNTGTKRRLNVSFKASNTLQLLQQQDFWR